MPKSWDLMIRAERVLKFKTVLNFTSGLHDPKNIIMKDKIIPHFVLEYFAKKDIPGLKKKLKSMKRWKNMSLSYQGTRWYWVDPATTCDVGTE